MGYEPRPTQPRNADVDGPRTKQAVQHLQRSRGVNSLDAMTGETVASSGIPPTTPTSAIAPQLTVSAGKPRLRRYQANASRNRLAAQSLD